MKKIIIKVYHELQRHYLTFRILVWLKEHGITRRINYFVTFSGDKKTVEKPTPEMLEAQKFYAQNKDRIGRIMEILADEKSKKVWGGVAAYRETHCPIPKEYYSEHDQYFCEDIIKLQAGEVFIDGGAYTGDTIQQFMDTCRKKRAVYKQIIALEPDKKNFMLLHKFYGKKDKILLLKKGLSCENKIVFFQESGAASKVTENENNKGTTKAAVASIDSMPECEEATFIKMDIEGAEMDALKGAEKTIKRNRPKLAICIYHSDEDMLRIIEYIHNLVPEYQIYVRHHSKSSVETVMYAVCKG